MCTLAVHNIFLETSFLVESTTGSSVNPVDLFYLDIGFQSSFAEFDKLQTIPICIKYIINVNIV